MFAEVYIEGGGGTWHKLAKTNKHEDVGSNIRNFEQTDFSNSPEHSLSIPNVQRAFLL